MEVGMQEVIKQQVARHVRWSVTAKHEVAVQATPGGCGGCLAGVV
jgi:hypothetical protein